MLGHALNSSRFNLVLSTFTALIAAPIAAFFLRVVEYIVSVDYWFLALATFSLSPLLGPFMTKCVVKLEDCVCEFEISIRQWGTTICSPQEKAQYVAKSVSLLIISGLVILLVIDKAPKGFFTPTEIWKYALVRFGLFETAVIVAALVVSTLTRLISRLRFVG